MAEKYRKKMFVINSLKLLPVREYSGTLSIAGKNLSCAVLSDGTRVLTNKAVFDAFDRPRKGKSVVDRRAENMPSFVDANNLKSFTCKAFGSGPERDYIIKYCSKS